MSQQSPLPQNESRVRITEIASSLLEVQMISETLDLLQFIPMEMQARFQCISLLRFEGVPLGPPSTTHWTPEAIMYWNGLSLTSPVSMWATSQRWLGFCCHGCRLARYKQGMNGSTRPPFTFWIEVPQYQGHDALFATKVLAAVWNCVSHLNTCVLIHSPLAISCINANYIRFVTFLTKFSEGLITTFHQRGLPMSLESQRLRQQNLKLEWKKNQQQQTRQLLQQQPVPPGNPPATARAVESPQLPSARKQRRGTKDENLDRKPATRLGAKHKADTASVSSGEASSKKPKHRKLQRVKIEQEEEEPITRNGTEYPLVNPDDCTTPSTSTDACETTVGGVDESTEANTAASTISPGKEEDCQNPLCPISDKNTHGKEVDKAVPTVSPIMGENSDTAEQAEPREESACPPPAFPEELEQDTTNELSGKGSALTETTNDEGGVSPIVADLLCKQNSPCMGEEVGQPKQPHAPFCSKAVDPKRIVWGNDQYNDTPGNKWYHSLILRVRGGHRKLSLEDQMYSLNELLDHIVSECEMAMVRWKDSTNGGQEPFAPLTREEQHRVVRHSLSQRFPDFLVKPFHMDALLEKGAIGSSMED